MDNWKSIIIGFFVFLFFALATFIAFASEKGGVYEDIPVIVHGDRLVLDTQPLLYQGRLLLPMRSVFEAMGATVSYDNVSREITAVKGETSITLKAGDKQAIVDGVPKMLDVPAVNLGNRVMVPLRFIGESYGAYVDWDRVRREVHIGTHKRFLGSNYIAKEATQVQPKRYLWPDGTILDGDIIGGSKNNYGLLYATDGTRYEGIFQKDAFAGEGKLTWPDGQWYKGTFVQDLFAGQGEYHWPTGKKYVGNWQSGLPQGQGRMDYEDRSSYDGSWLAGLYHGQGTKVYSSGETVRQYTGDWSMGVWQGQGKLEYTNGDMYEGGFTAGKYDGQGTLRYGYGGEKSGLWKDGKFVNE